MKALTYGLVVSSVSWHLEPYKEALTLILNILHQFLKIILSLLTTCFPCPTTFEIIIAWSVTICNKTWSFRRYCAISSPIPPIIDDFPPWSILSNCTWSACVIGGAVSFEAFTRSAYTGYTMLRFRRKLATNTANYQRVHFVQLINLIPLVHDHATLAIPPAFCLNQKYEHKEIMSVLMLNPTYSD